MKLPVYFLSHGGGPWPWLKAEMPGVYDALEASLQRIPREIGATPKAVVVISGHWEEGEFTVMASPKPPMLYDYYGFPPRTYAIQYPAPGSTEVAGRIQELLRHGGFTAPADPRRGFDHGTFVPLAVMYPQADVPVVQVSIRSDYDADAHLALGRALAPLREEGILLIASGLTYHNLMLMDARGAKPSREFDEWLRDAVCGSAGNERARKLATWRNAPSARIAHPREDHLIPLIAAAGAAQEEAAERVYHEDAFFGHLAVSSYRFGALPAAR